MPRKKHTNRVAQHFKSKWTSSSSSSYQGDQRLQLYPWKLSRFQRVPERTNNTFLRYNMNPTDEYMTPPLAWEAIQKYIPKNKVIWEAFYGDGKSGDTLRTLGFKVIHDKVDFFENNLGVVIVSNPPNSKLPQILERLAHPSKQYFLMFSSAENLVASPKSTAPLSSSCKHREKMMSSGTPCPRFERSTSN